MDFALRRGRTLDLGPAPSGGPARAATVRSVGLIGRDYIGLALDPAVAEGQRVRRGAPLCHDRHHPEIALVAPVAGRIGAVRLGRRRRIETIEIVPEEAGTDADEVHFDIASTQGDDAALRRLLMASGSWAALRSRPFGRVPAPGERPAAIFVTATDTNPLAADPAAILALQQGAFRLGVAALLRLTEGPVFVCQPPGPWLAEPRDRLRVERVAGPHPAGLAGSQIHRLFPASARRVVWQIGGQEVAAIGQLLTTGRIAAQRTVSVAGPGLARPALVTAPLGAALADLAPGAAAPPLSGSPLTGAPARFLRRHDLQVTVPDASGRVAPRPAWLRHFDTLLGRLADPRGAGATLPMEAYERAFPFDILPVPLMRALAVGDVETAERLGCLELLEEDMALLTWLCPSGSDYGALLRHALDTLAAEAVA